MKGIEQKKINFVIAYHETTPSPFPENLRKFLLENYPGIDLLYMTHPLLEIKESYQLSSKYVLYKSGKKVEDKKAFHWVLPTPLLFVKDVIYTFWWLIKFGKIWDVVFAADSLSALVAIILQKFGIVGKVVYYCMDYYPVRFSNPILNWLYFQLDAFCATHSDETWNVTKNIINARKKKMNLGKEYLKKQFIVPGGIWFYKTKRKPFSKIDKFKIMYRGSLHDFMGVELILDAMPRLIKKFPKIKLEILGGGDRLNLLKTHAKNLKIEKYVKFYGWVNDRSKLEEILSTGAIGLAPFNTKILDEKIINADPGKIKDYMLVSMPVITTNAVWYYKEIEKNKSGIVIDYDVEELIEAVAKLLSGEKMLKEYRENAAKFIEPMDWNNILKKNIPRVVN